MSEITEKYGYGVATKPEGKWILYRILLISVYVLYPVLAIGAMMIIKPELVFVGALLAVSDAILVFFTWRFVSFDHEYEVESGKVTYTVVHNAFNHRIKKPQMEFMLKECTAIAPLNNPEHPECAKQYEDYKAEVVYNALSWSKAEDAYFALFTTADGRRAAFLFQATGDMLKRCRWYNKEATVVVPTRI